MVLDVQDNTLILTVQNDYETMTKLEYNFKLNVKNYLVLKYRP